MRSSDHDAETLPRRFQDARSQAWTEELEDSIDRPYGDEEPPPPGTNYEEILRGAGTARKRGLLPEDARDKAPERREPAVA